MISLNHISIHFTGENLLDDISFIIADHDRIGLVGKNGAGKSTLLKIIKREISPDNGQIIYSQNTSIGHLPQDMTIESERTVIEEAQTAFDHILKLKVEIDQLTDQLTVCTDYESESYSRLIQRFEESNHLFNLLGGNAMKGETERVLKGLGFLEEDFQRPVNTFSSGWQMRVELAKILLRNPSVILLDEPTNHLDIEAITWLEEWIQNFQGALVVVSHDRAFLDNVTHRTIEISQGKIYDFKSSYSEYIVIREEQLEQQLAAYENQQRQIAQIERFIERFRYKATKARQVQSRIKLLEKMDKIEIDGLDRSSIHFRFPPPPSSGKIVVEIKNLSKKYDNKVVLQNIDFTLVKGEKVAFVGRNGEGKSTLSKIIAAGLDYEGIFRLGYNVKIGYYAQNQSELLDLNKTVYETLDETAKGEIRTRLKSILGSFLFSGEAIEKKVEVLSGGEKARLALAKLLLEPVNLLVLDEPTNHLDMLSKDILKAALLDYSGSMIIVSHDRDFLQGLTHRVIEFKQHHINEYLGDIYDFLSARQIDTLRELDTENKIIQNNQILQQSQNKIEYEKRKAHERKRRKIISEIEKCEEAVFQTDNELAEMEHKLANPAQYQDTINSKDFFNRYDYLKKKSERLMTEWEDLHLMLEELDHSDLTDS
ncbi:MAG TPA: ABC-F family ATP-binding cassette domain-containing protein [Bacteroidales bacterium]|jgi:ATP-binding cassette subfamily F protein 3|nr:MAG: putative ABC transporter ATP-binding protein YheS [Bacteroidetes bacterium ADurb.Bin012]HNQ60248.1 ABC-F family ATP-binding cassette domain-containing protein [Bacteroidales bacterium]HNU22415.1 ABC-F family ATP-binding cassette domain-containing protein [Bacteroidales bacterium]HNV17515.1 ABC-F family ATP-binding cassette domain-containing protein [Bacteroidales bacterium]HNZ79685.1 ABC-F family ATP-binding cassette domain-containing protein [Bacteroidales bacterium]